MGYNLVGVIFCSIDNWSKAFKPSPNKENCSRNIFFFSTLTNLYIHGCLLFIIKPMSQVPIDQALVDIIFCSLIRSIKYTRYGCLLFIIKPVIQVLMDQALVDKIYFSLISRIKYIRQELIYLQPYQFKLIYHRIVFKKYAFG